MQQAHLLISGKVQGVVYRASCQDVAVKCGVKGWVVNLSSGQVEVVAQGTKEQLEKLIEWCKKGPPHAEVSNMQIEWQDASEEFAAFEIL